MRVGLVRNVGLSITALAVLALGGCNDDPLSFDVKDTVGIQVNPSEMVVAAGRTAELESRAVNEGNEPTFDDVNGAVDPICGQGSIQVIKVQQLEIEPPGLFVITGGSVLGQTCVVLTSGSNTAQVDVTVVADAIEITAPDDGTVYRAGATDQVVAQLIGFDGTPAGPYAVEDAVFTSDDALVANFTDDQGNFVTGLSGSATLTVTWAGQALNGTSGLGVVRSDDILIEVGANVPASAIYAAPVDTDGFGAIAGGSTTESEVLVLDALGNQNTVPGETTACTVTSSNEVVATATCFLLVTPDAVQVFVEVTALAPGAALIGGTVTTSEGPFIYLPAAVVVLAPEITGFGPETGTVGQVMQVTGTGLAATGFDTDVTVDGVALDPMFMIGATDTQVDFFMPDLGNTNDAFEINVEVGGVAAPAGFTYTQLADAAADEPANDNPATATPITFPLDKVGSFELLDVDDFHLFSATAGQTIQIDLDWDDHSVDLDILVTDEGVTAFVCTAGATGAAPESDTCEIPADGNYQLWINNYSGPGNPTSYRLEAVVQ